MGGFANVLGDVASGYVDQSQKETQRQFADEQNRRGQIVDMLGKLAQDPTAHPDTRNAAFNMALETLHTPWNKPVKPDFNKLVTTTPQQTLATASPANTTQSAPGVQAQQAKLGQGSTADAVSNIANYGNQVKLIQPPSPPGLHYTPQEQAQLAAQKAGMVEGATAGAQLHSLVPSYDAQGRIQMNPISGAGTQLGQPVGNAVVPSMFGMAARSLHPVVIAGPDGTPVAAQQDKTGIMGGARGAVYDQDGQLIPNAQIFSPALLGHTTTESMNSAGAVTKQSTPKTTQKGGQQQPARPQLAQPPQPPAGADLSAIAGGQAPAGMEAPPSTPVPSIQAPSNGQAASRPKPARPNQHGGAPKPSVGSPEWVAKADPVSLDAWDWATQGRKPAGGPMAERQVRAKMAQLGFQQPAIAIPPAMQQKVQESFVARNSAIDIIDDIQRNKQVFNSLLSSGKIAVASSPDGSGVVQRAAGLSDQEARVAGDFEQLIEHANLLRGPLGATGFRGKEAWNALQAQRGKPLGDPRITDQVMSGMRDRLVKLNSADKLVLGGQGMSGASATGGRRISKAAVDKAAQDHGVDSATAEQQAREQGYEVY